MTAGEKIVWEATTCQIKAEQLREAYRVRDFDLAETVQRELREAAGRLDEARAESERER